jgi:hypothetical protein
MPSNIELPRDTPIHDAPKCPVGKVWPRPVHRRLEQLVDIARLNGENTNGTELLPAIVAAFGADPKKISDVLRTYRMSRAGDHVIDGDDDKGDVLQLRPKERGRPPRSG